MMVNKILHLKQNNKGIGLLELLLSLVIISVLLTVAFRFFKPTNLSQRSNETIDMIQAIATAEQRWLMTNNEDPGNVLKTFVERGFLPDSFLNAKNPWGGDMKVTWNEPDKEKHLGPYVQITMPNLSSQACDTLAAKGTRLVCSPNPEYIKCNDGEFTINLDSICPSTVK
jgi:type II secretory pathway pseudopilin PulG